MGSCRRNIAFALMIASFVLAGGAQAATFIYTFTGELTEVEGNAPFTDGQMVTGTIIFSDDLAVKSSSPSQTVYDGMGMLTFTVEGFGPSAPINELVIVDSGEDAFQLRSSAFLDSSEFLLVDGDGVVFDGFAIPGMLALDDFDDAEFTLDLPGSGIISGSLTELTMVPEPATAALLVLGLFGLGVAGRRS